MECNYYQNVENQEVNNIIGLNVPNSYEPWVPTSVENQLGSFFSNIIFNDQQEQPVVNQNVVTTVVPEKSSHVGNNHCANNSYYFNGDNLLPLDQPSTSLPITLPSIEQYLDPGQALPTLGEYLEPQEGQKKFQCNLCERWFTKFCYLAQHNDAKHNDEKQHKCFKCGKKFACQQSLFTHSQRHQGDKPHKCRFCPKQYNFSSDLNRHMFVHNKDNPYNCLTCGKGFARRDHLKNHESSHERKAALYNMRRPMF